MVSLFGFLGGGADQGETDTTLTELVLPEKEVLEKMNEVLMAKRMGNMVSFFSSSSRVEGTDGLTGFRRYIMKVLERGKRTTR